MVGAPRPMAIGLTANVTPGLTGHKARTNRRPQQAVASRHHLRGRAPGCCTDGLPSAL